MLFYITFALLLVLLITMSALFSFSEMAISSSSKTRLLTIIDSKEANERAKKKAKRVLYFVDNYNEHITAIVIFNNIVNILFSTLATVFFTFVAEDAWGNPGYGALLSFVVTTPLVIIFGEIVPKQLAKKYPEKGTMVMAIPIKIVALAMKPATFVLGKIIKEEDNTTFLSDQEINTALSQTTEAGVTTLFEQELIKRLLLADEKSVADVMVPIKEVVTIPKDITKSKLDLLIMESKYTRYPVVDKKNNVVSLFSSYNYLLDKLKGSAKDFEDYTFSFSTFNIDENPFHILEALRHRREKMAIIIDEEDKFVGIVAVEDVIELIVGEIYDEGDVENDGVYSLNEGSYILNADVSIEYWLKEYKVNIKPTAEIKKLTIEKWVQSLKGAKPKHGDSFTYKNAIIWVRKDKFNSKNNVYEIDIIENSAK